MLTPCELMIEGVVVGVALLVLSLLIEYVGNSLIGRKTRWPPNQEMVNGILVSGAAFHILAELAGVNEWYCKRRCKNL